jgi:dipeptidyl aminopeptidase/acylaminoacyl peptidase
MALGASAALSIAWHAYRTEKRSFEARRHPPRLNLAEFLVPGLVEAAFRSRSGEWLRGYFARSRTGAVVVLAHGACGERSDLAEEARLLGAAGLGVLAFDWPGHGQSEGAIGWGEGERQALLGALDWLAQQPGVDPQRLGAFGFSMGGYVVAQVAAGDPRLRAVALAGTPHDAFEHTRWEYRRGGWLRQWPALLALRSAGMKLDELVPERVVAAIAPRPLLLIAGADDRVVPLWIAERLEHAAREPKRLLVVSGAAHGGYYAADPATYGRTLRDFFLPLAD